MSLTRITNVAGTSRITSIRVLKKDTGDAANTNAANTVRLKKIDSAYLTASWVYSPSTAGGGYTHYADIDITSLDGPTGYYYLVTFYVEVRDTDSDTWQVYTSMFDVDVTTVLYEAAATVPSEPELEIGISGSNSQPLNWSAPAGSPDGYRLFRSTSPSTGFVQIGGDLTGTSYNSTGLQPATRYYYYLVAFNAIGNSAPSETVSDITTSQTTGTEVPVPTVIRDNAANELYRHASRYVVTTVPFGVIEMEVGSSLRTGVANAEGVCTLLPLEKIPTDVTTVRFRAKSGTKVSAWTSAINVVDAPNSIPWAAVLPAEDKYEAWKVTFPGDPDTLPRVDKILKISVSPREDEEAAWKDAQNYLNSL